MKRGTLIFLCLTGLVAVYLILSNLKLPDGTFFWSELHNTGHTPLFAIVALCVLGVLSGVFRKKPHAGFSRYLWAFIITVTLGALYEISQIWGPGDADIVDLIRDIGGAFPALVFAMVLHKGPEAYARRIKPIWRYALVAIAALVLVVAFAPLILWGAAYYQRDRSYPTIMNFDSPLELKFIQMQDAYLDVVPPPSDWKRASGAVGKLTLFSGEYPGLEISEPYPDWTAKKFLKFDIYSTQSSPRNLTIRIDDIHHNQEFNDRYNHTITISPGDNAISLPLDDIRKAPASRETDMKAIRNLMIFTGASKDTLIFFMDNIRLE